jgi:hypothetical protein
MDQLKKALAEAAKHQFWIITGLAAVMACLAWFMTNSSLNKQFTDNAATIDSKYKAMQQVSSAVPTHPNDFSKTEMEKIINGLATDVESAWSLQYKRQEQYLQWREEAIKLPTLIAKLKKLYPIEQKATYPDEPKSPFVSVDEKKRFALYFAEQMPELAKIIGVTWVGEASSVVGGGGAGPGMGMEGMGDGAEGGDGGGMGGAMGGMGGAMGGMGGAMGGMGGAMGGMGGGGMSTAQMNDIVLWPKPSQSKLLTSMRMWQGDQPTVYQIMYTQENIWILEGILNIIAKTNLVPETGKPATANFQATIKEIEFIRIGRDAIASAGSITGMASGGGGGAEGMMGMGMSGMGMSGMSGMGNESESESGSEGEGAAGGAMGTGGGMFRDPADQRYVDAAYKPISGDELRTKITSKNPEDAYFAVAKRIPVRMKFKIDFSQLHRFLANCGNEGLMLEVRQVRVGKFSNSTGGMGDGGGGMGGPGMGGPGMGGMGMGAEGGDGGEEMGSEGMSGMGGMGDGGMGMGGMGMGGPGMGGPGMGGPGMGGSGMGGMGGLGGAMALKKPVELPVEVYGVVYLFNPGNIESLGLSKVTEDTEVKDSVASPDSASQPTDPVDVPSTPVAPGESTDTPVTPADSPATPPDSTPATPPATPAGTAAGN